MQQLVTFAQLSLFDLNISVRYFTAFKISALKNPIWPKIAITD